jgi:uncharacterized protein (TIGR03067 family)
MPRTRPRDDDDDYDDEPTPRRKKKRRSESRGNGTVWALGVVVGLLLLAGVAGVVALYAHKNRDTAEKPTEKPAEKTPSQPAPQGPVTPVGPGPVGPGPGPGPVGPVGPGPVGPVAPPKTRTLQGVWLIVTIEHNGRTEQGRDGARIIISGKKMTSHFAGGRRVVSEIRVDDTREPKEIDIVSAGRVYPGIYRIEGDTLRICINETGAARPQAFSAAGLVGSGGMTTYKFVE